MLDVHEVLLTAERELLSSDTLARTTKAGILFGVLTEAMRAYTRTPVSASEVLALMTVLVRDGKLLDALPRGEQSRTLTSLLTTHGEQSRDGKSKAASPDRGDRPAADPPDDNNVEDPERAADIRVMRANGYSDTEIEAILALQDAAGVGTEVVSRTDADLAAHEEEKNNPFPGVPRGLQLRPNGIVGDYTMTTPEPIPTDLTK